MDALIAPPRAKMYTVTNPDEEGLATSLSAPGNFEAT
jgi:hypothetical protein